MANDPTRSERDFHQEAFNIAKKRKISKTVNEFQKKGELAKAYPENLASPRYIHPDKLLDDVKNRYVF